MRLFLTGFGALSAVGIFLVDRGGGLAWKSRWWWRGDGGWLARALFKEDGGFRKWTRAVLLLPSIAMIVLAWPLFHGRP